MPTIATTAINPLAGTSGSLTSSSTTSSTSSSSSTSSATSSALGGTESASDLANSFLTMLVTQMKNQDPLNPMDSDEVTSQMAQISTVEGVQQLNTSITGLGTQFTQMSALQGASLVGTTVATDGDSLAVNSSTGVGQGGFELASAASSVQVAVVNSAGETIDTMQLGALNSGLQSFSYNVPQADQGQALTFQVTATNDGSQVTATPLTFSTVDAITTQSGSLQLELDNGQTVNYTDVQAIL